MFESITGEPTQLDANAHDAEERRLRWFEPLSKLVVLPIAWIVAALLPVVLSWPGITFIPLFCIIYAALGMFASWVYDKALPPPIPLDIYDRISLGLEVARASFVTILVGIVVGLLLLFSPF